MAEHEKDCGGASDNHAGKDRGHGDAFPIEAQNYAGEGSRSLHWYRNLALFEFPPRYSRRRCYVLRFRCYGRLGVLACCVRRSMLERSVGSRAGLMPQSGH